jgi:hypothetical protein
MCVGAKGVLGLVGLAVGGSEFHAFLFVTALISYTFFIVIFVPHRPGRAGAGALFAQAGTGLKEPVLGHGSPRLAPA